MCLVDDKGRNPLPGDMITFSYWSFSCRESKYGLVVSVYQKKLDVEPEDSNHNEESYVAVMLLLQNGELNEYYAFSDDMIIIHTR